MKNQIHTGRFWRALTYLILSMFLIPPVTVLWPSQSLSTWPEQKNPFLKCENPHGKILFTCKMVLKMMARKETNSLTLTPSHTTDPISHTLRFWLHQRWRIRMAWRKTYSDLTNLDLLTYGTGIQWLIRDEEEMQKNQYWEWSVSSLTFRTGVQCQTHCFISKNMFSSTFILGCILKVETCNTIAEVWFLTRRQEYKYTSTICQHGYWLQRSTHLIHRPWDSPILKLLCAVCGDK